MPLGDPSCLQIDPPWSLDAPRSPWTHPKSNGKWHQIRKTKSGNLVLLKFGANDTSLQSSFPFPVAHACPPGKRKGGPYLSVFLALTPPNGTAKTCFRWPLGTPSPPLETLPKPCGSMAIWLCGYVAMWLYGWLPTTYDLPFGKLKALFG